MFDNNKESTKRKKIGKKKKNRERNHLFLCRKNIDSMEVRSVKEVITNL